MVEPETPVPLPPVLQGRYQVGPVLGRGGASVVYRAHDLLLGRTVAVKVFTTTAVDARALSAQEGEARLLGGLNHPGLVTLLDAGIDTSDPAAPQVFLIMEYVDGADLRRRLRSGALGPLEVCYLAWDLLGALGYIHAQGVIHRDLKPANVLLTAEARDRPPRGKLADFGIAVLRGHVEEPDGETTGTAAYLSPEQVEGRPLSTSTDIYSLGLVLLEAFTARTPFPGDPIDSALIRLDRDPAIPPDMPAEIASIIRAMTDRRPEARPTASEAAAAFRQVMARSHGGERPPVRDPERERIAAVRDLNLVGTPPDAEFDRITALAARMFDVPIAVISIVDEKRVWLKSRQGVEAQELPRADGLGSSGSLHEEVLIVEDVGTDPRTANVPSAQRSPYRFYAGVPLITSDGHNIGSFAIADTKPRRMTATEVASLEDLAAMTLHEMELRRAARRIALRG